MDFPHPQNSKDIFGYPHAYDHPQMSNKFWGIWLPVPTFLAIIVSVFFTWLILSTVGYTESPIEKAGERIIEQF